MTPKYNILNNNSENKSVCKYMNLKRMLLVLYAHTHFNKICLKQNLTPMYARLKKSNNLVLEYFIVLYFYTLALTFTHNTYDPQF
jgi:hypothetical protein